MRCLICASVLTNAPVFFFFQELVLGANAVEEVFALLMLSSRAGRHNAARVLAELSVADVNSTHLTMQREKVSKLSACNSRYDVYGRACSGENLLFFKVFLINFTP